MPPTTEREGKENHDTIEELPDMKRSVVTWERLGKVRLKGEPTMRKRYKAEQDMAFATSKSEELEPMYTS